METVILLALLALATINLAFFFFITLKIEKIMNLVEQFEAKIDLLIETNAEILEDITWLKEEFERVNGDQGISRADAERLYERLVGAAQSAREAADLIPPRTPAPDPDPTDPTDPEEPTDPE